LWFIKRKKLNKCDLFFYGEPENKSVMIDQLISYFKEALIEIMIQNRRKKNDYFYIYFEFKNENSLKMKQTFKLKKVSINDVTLSSLNLSNVSKPLDKTFLKEVRIILNKPLSLTLDNNVHCDGRDYKTINIDELEQKVDKTVYDLKDRKITKKYIK